METVPKFGYNGRLLVTFAIDSETGIRSAVSEHSGHVSIGELAILSKDPAVLRMLAGHCNAAADLLELRKAQAS